MTIWDWLTITVLASFLSRVTSSFQNFLDTIGLVFYVTLYMIFYSYACALSDRLYACTKIKLWVCVVAMQAVLSQPRDAPFIQPVRTLDGTVLWAQPRIRNGDFVPSNHSSTIASCQINMQPVRNDRIDRKSMLVTALQCCHLQLVPTLRRYEMYIPKLNYTQYKRRRVRGFFLPSQPI